MKERAFVIGDVHGMADMLKQLLKEWDREHEQLIFVGDLVDRGPKIKETLQIAIDLQNNHDAKIIRGNHEAMLLEFLTDAEKYWPRYQRNSGITTLSELTGDTPEALSSLSLDDLVAYVKERQPWLESWIQSLPHYIEYGDWVIVHAGVDLAIDDWKASEPTRFYWIRDEFHQTANNTGKKFLFGHTPLPYLNGDFSNLTIWQQQDKVGIDAGAVYGGDLVGLHIHRDGRIFGESRVNGKGNFVDND
ncbi:serine/threonine protein phosphatase [Aerococcaceae bacterium zg-BR9]|uniref:metallophosphoesterase n=1 Tax=Aerococcaceae bacterium zg-1292 TaxID=2774330 RepID=UPI0040629C0A|nr:serine/threonine protein phosphatase [Aerococcaceae bacterium zg-BR9]